MNSASGIVVAGTSTSTVIGGTVFHRNTVDLGGSATAGQYAINVSNNKSVFVDPAEGFFYPSLNSPVIDASVDSLEDRSSLIAVKQPLGLQLSPIIAPTADINGLLRVDDPTVETPAGLGENVFKDRGAADRADLLARLSSLSIQPTMMQATRIKTPMKASSNFSTPRCGTSTSNCWIRCDREARPKAREFWIRPSLRPRYCSIETTCLWSRELIIALDTMRPTAWFA